MLDDLLERYVLVSMMFVPTEEVVKCTGGGTACQGNTQHPFIACVTNIYFMKRACCRLLDKKVRGRQFTVR